MRHFIRETPSPSKWENGSSGAAQPGSLEAGISSALWTFTPARKSGIIRCLPAPVAPARSRTAGGLVFFGEQGGTFNAVDAKTGKPLWHFESGQTWRASPMTYMVGGKQYVVLAGTGGIFTFALVK